MNTMLLISDAENLIFNLQQDVVMGVAAILMFHATNKYRQDLKQWSTTYFTYFILNIIIHHFYSYHSNLVGMAALIGIGFFVWAANKTYKDEIAKQSMIQKDSLKKKVLTEIVPVPLSVVLIFMLGPLIFLGISIYYLIKLVKIKPKPSLFFLLSNLVFMFFNNFQWLINNIAQKEIIPEIFGVGLAHIMNSVFLMTPTIIIIESNLERSRKKLQQTQEMLISQARIESIQLIAAGFSHDLNNLLTGLNGTVEILKFEELPKNTTKGLNDIQSISTQISNLSNQLMALAKKEEHLEKSPININNLLKKVVNFSLSGRKSKEIFEFSDENLQISGDTAQLGQVFQNLVINADQAMGDGGVITITVTKTNLERNNKYKLSSGEYVKIEVTDDGEGIPTHLHKKIFNPFFTTKKEGSGLGLTICQSIIQNHNGYINFITELNKGTTFYIYLPLTHFPPEHVMKEKGVRKKFHGNAYILEDNHNVLKVLDNYLTELGINCTCMSESTTFLRNIENSVMKNERIDLFFIDLTLPGDANVKNVVERLLITVPDAYIIAASGYNKDYVQNNFNMDNFKDFLKKPFLQEDLIEILKNWDKTTI